mgnify:CR=1 FL=1|jgi:hypothetical protein
MEDYAESPEFRQEAEDLITSKGGGEAEGAGGASAAMPTQAAEAQAAGAAQKPEGATRQ